MAAVRSMSETGPKLEVSGQADSQYGFECNFLCLGKANTKNHKFHDLTQFEFSQLHSTSSRHTPSLDIMFAVRAQGVTKPQNRREHPAARCASRSRSLFYLYIFSRPSTLAHALQLPAGAAMPCPSKHG
eukprot:753779-Hanusia_phi.AAC.2